MHRRTDLATVIRDPLTDEYTLAGTTRDARPNEYLRGSADRCAFCPGNEDRTPPELARVAANEGSWLARAFSNKYPAIVPPDGRHEVIVDSPDHDHEISVYGLELWAQRYREGLAFSATAHPVLFKNSGVYSGATIVHPHTQLVVLDSRPARMQAMLDRAKRRRDTSGTCIFCDERETNRKHVVFEDEYVSAFTREASRFSSSLTILPKHCTPSLLQSESDEWVAVSSLLRALTGNLRASGGGVPFNILVFSEPHCDPSAFHWHIEVVPRFFTLAGFELATGSFIRTSGAQEAAQVWRQMIAPPDGSV